MSECSYALAEMRAQPISEQVERYLAQKRQQAIGRLVEMAALSYDAPRREYEEGFQSLLSNCAALRRLKTNGRRAELTVVMPNGERRKIVAKNTECAGRDPKFDALDQLAREWMAATGAGASP